MVKVAMEMQLFLAKNEKLETQKPEQNVLVNGRLRGLRIYDYLLKYFQLIGSVKNTKIKTTETRTIQTCPDTHKIIIKIRLFPSCPPVFPLVFFLSFYCVLANGEYVLMYPRGVRKSHFKCHRHCWTGKAIYNFFAFSFSNC